ncbi:MAG: peptide-methionine (S)-S-oxide reductase MsrA [Gammaproteobacteria bacterium]|nr:peptide-methionine (S)-S-oxide reductase MsrA [Gammaproteobacteria bacterium]MDD9896061.1 peptide-methionine (S)-S-oxide reductase MsrA [Gammaproteobacteria bacterium]MDD9958612.1 peptide-methionine (S)-S-oxide reductase MsrA [Gammaproteobacteria bacterium]
MLFGLSNKSLELPSREDAIPDRAEVVRFSREHFVNRNPIADPVPRDLAKAVFGMGCFWGAERLFWQLPGVYSTAAGYAGGITANPTYEDVCSGMTGHTEVVLVYYDPGKCDYEDLLSQFWESHDPTQGMRQGNDRGTQYRSAIYTTEAEQLLAAERSRTSFQEALAKKGYPEITTEIRELEKFYYAEDYHQQYLAKNPNGYCGLAGTGACYKSD